MKVLHYMPTIDRSSGGLASYMQILANSLGKLVELHVITHHSENEVKLSNCDIHYLGSRLLDFFKIQKAFVEIINEIQPDIFHSNCCWYPYSSFFIKWASKLGYKTMYTPHGMLEPWILKRHYWSRKVPALLLYQKSSLKCADIIHATAISERDNIIKLGYNSNVVVVPNGLNVDNIEIKSTWNRTKKILFLSRVHEKKGIEILINAVAELKTYLDGYKFLIAGEGDRAYINILKYIVKEKGLDDIIVFVGGVYGDEKWKLYHQADIFILPTHSENFGIVIAEALASGTPVITTTGAPWEDIQKYNCGWWVPCSQHAIVEALRSAIELSEAELEIRGKNGRKLIEEKYSDYSVSDMLKKQYEKLLKDSSCS